MFELPTLNSLDAIDRQQVHYATIQLNGSRFPIDTADYFNLVIHRALHEAGLTVEMLCQELRLDMSAVEDMLQSKVFCPDELALISFHLRLDTAFMMEAHAALTLPSCSKPSTVVAEPADTLKECVVNAWLQDAEPFQRGPRLRPDRYEYDLPPSPLHGLDGDEACQGPECVP